MCLRYAKRIQHTGGVIGELLQAEVVCTRLGKSHATVVEGDHLVVRAKRFEQGRLPQVHRAPMAHDHHQWVPTAVDAVTYLDVTNLHTPVGAVGRFGERQRARAKQTGNQRQVRSRTFHAILRVADSIPRHVGARPIP